MPSGDLASYQLSSSSSLAGIDTINGGMMALPEPDSFHVSSGIWATASEASVKLGGDAKVAAVRVDGTGKVDQEVIIESPSGSGFKWRLSSYTAFKPYTVNGKIGSDTELTVIKTTDPNSFKKIAATDTFNPDTRKYELHFDLGNGKRVDLGGRHA